MFNDYASDNYETSTRLLFSNEIVISSGSFRLVNADKIMLCTPLLPDITAGYFKSRFSENDRRALPPGFKFPFRYRKGIKFYDCETRVRTSLSEIDLKLCLPSIVSALRFSLVLRFCFGHPDEQSSMDPCFSKLKDTTWIIFTTVVFQNTRGKRPHFSTNRNTLYILK